MLPVYFADRNLRVTSYIIYFNAGVFCLLGWFYLLRYFFSLRPVMYNVYVRNIKSSWLTS